METNEVLPPGEHPFDTRRPNADQIAYALERLQTFLIWIEEHRASFEKGREADPRSADAELRNLQDATEQAVLHLDRLTGLLLAGYSIDLEKELPKGLGGPVWSRWVQILREERKV